MFFSILSIFYFFLFFKFVFYFVLSISLFYFVYCFSCYVPSGRRETGDGRRATGGGQWLLLYPSITNQSVITIDMYSTKQQNK